MPALAIAAAAAIAIVAAITRRRPTSDGALGHTGDARRAASRSRDRHRVEAERVRGRHSPWW